MPPAGPPPTARSAGARASAAGLLRDLQRLSGASYGQLLAVPAEQARRALGAASLSLSRWERDRGVLRCLVNVGELGPGEEAFPEDEVYDLRDYEGVISVVDGVGVAYDDGPGSPPAGLDLLHHHGKTSAVSVPLHVGDRLWGELWATTSGDQPRFGQSTVAAAIAVAAAVAPMLEVVEIVPVAARLAFEDPLTGLGNRRALDDALAQWLTPGGPGVTIVLCDVDGLKATNDDHGHEAGDRVIVAVADALAETTTWLAGAVAVRIGGDEFALVTPGIERSMAVQAVQKVARTLAGHEPPVRVSCGVTTSASGTSPRDALAAADAAQYAAKRRGALVVVSSDLGGDPEPAPAPRRRRLRPVAPPADDVSAVAHAVALLTPGLESAPRSPGGALTWLGEHLLGPFALDRWSLSRTDLAAGVLTVASVGLRHGAPDTGDALQVDAEYLLADYPLSAEAVRSTGVFAVSVDEEGSDPGEREVLEQIGVSYVVALGTCDGTTGWLLELYGHSGSHSAARLRDVVQLLGSALLGRRVVALDHSGGGGPGL